MAQRGHDSQNPKNGKHPNTGQQLVKVVSPAQGAHPTNPAGAGTAVLPSPCSVLGTGVNVDRLVYTAEAV